MTDSFVMKLPLRGLSMMNADFDGDALNFLFLGSYKDGIVQQFEAFHCSCMTNYAMGKVTLDLLDWSDICLGLMSE